MSRDPPCHPVLTVWGDPAKFQAFGLFFAPVAAHLGTAELPNGPHFGVSDFAAYDRLVRAAGFGDATTEEVPIAWRTASVDTVLADFGDWAQMDAWPAGGRAYEVEGVLTIPNPVILVAAVR